MNDMSALGNKSALLGANTTHLWKQKGILTTIIHDFAGQAENCVDALTISVEGPSSSEVPAAGLPPLASKYSGAGCRSSLVVSALTHMISKDDTSSRLPDGLFNLTKSKGRPRGRPRKESHLLRSSRTKREGEYERVAVLPKQQPLPQREQTLSRRRVGWGKTKGRAVKGSLWGIHWSYEWVTNRDPSKSSAAEAIAAIAITDMGIEQD